MTDWTDVNQVVRPVKCRLTNPGIEPKDVLCVFSYSQSDPMAVWLCFSVDEDEIPWVVGRELLISGLAGSDGMGDVRIWRSDINDVLWMTFDTPEGYAKVEFPRLDVCLFVDDTLKMCPAGTEAARLDIDALVASLLDES